MPLPAESLTPDSTPEDIKAAISASIEQCMKEGGRPQQQCVAMAIEMARRATASGSGGPAERNIRAGLSQPTGAY